MKMKSVFNSAVAATVFSIGAAAFGTAPAFADCPPETPDHPYFQPIFQYCYETQELCVEAQDGENNDCSKFKCVHDEDNCPGGVGATAMYVTYVPYPWN